MKSSNLEIQVIHTVAPWTRNNQPGPEKTWLTLMWWANSRSAIGDWKNTACEVIPTFHRPPENERMSPEKEPFQKETSSSNHWFSGDMLVFQGVSEYLNWITRFGQRYPYPSTFTPHPSTFTPWLPHHETTCKCWTCWCDNRGDSSGDLLLKLGNVNPLVCWSCYISYQFIRHPWIGKYLFCGKNGAFWHVNFGSWSCIDGQKNQRQLVI